MPLGPGALGFLTQPTHFNAPNPADSWMNGVDAAKGWAAQDRRLDMDEESQKRAQDYLGLQQERFAYEQSEQKRLEKAKAYDDIYGARSAEELYAAVGRARLRGIEIPGLEEHLRRIRQQSPEAPKDESATAPANEPTPKAPAAAAPSKTSEKSPQVGEDIGGGWEVMETPEEAKRAPEAALPPLWLRNEMEARGELPPTEAHPELFPIEAPEATQTTQAPIAEEASSVIADGVKRPAVPPLTMGGVGQFTGAPALPFQVVDADTGKVLGTYDADAVMSRGRGMVSEAFSPLLGNARTPEETRAATIAQDTANRLLPYMSPDKAIAAGMLRYDKELGRDTAKRVARGGKGDAEPGEGALGKTQYEEAGRTPEQIRAIKTVADYVHLRILQKAQQVHNTKEIQRISGVAQSIAAKVQGEKGFSQRQAIRSVLQMTEGAKQTDNDLRYALEGGGALGVLHMSLKSWIDGGTLPDNFKQQISDYAALLGILNKQKQLKAAAYARELALNDPGLRDMVGPEKVKEWAEQAARGAMGEAIGDVGVSSNEESGDDDSAADAVMGGD